MTSLLMAVLLLGDCISVDRCLLAKGIDHYRADAHAGQTLVRQLQPHVVPCTGACHDRADGDELFYQSIQALLPVLAGRLRAGEPVAWSVSLSLLRFTDGGLKEDLSATVSRAVAAQPAAFLRAARDLPLLQPGSVVGMLGEEFVDAGPDKRCGALRERLVALAAVADPALRPTRHATVRALRLQVDKCK